MCRFVTWLAGSPMPVKKDLDQGYYISDAPVTDPREDRFGRWPFARRLAHTISSRSDPAGLVIGLYGAWGTGKTTVLNFMKRELTRSKHLVCVPFNPWLFRGDEQLIRSFFATLASAIGKSPGLKAKIGKLLERYGPLIAPVSVSYQGVELSPGEGLAEAGRALSVPEIDDLRVEISEALVKSKTRVVVLMDDIDRLDKSELHSVFKLIKLSADFQNTVYVLAFDDEMVAAALGEKYGGGDVEAGRQFLEKIVQVPLVLPAANPDALRRFCLDGLGRALEDAQVHLSEDEQRQFYWHFLQGLAIRLRTPRMAKRYENAVAFALPLLREEVNEVDLLLVEGLRVFYPQLYAVVRDNRDVVLRLQPSGTYTREKATERSRAIISDALKSLRTEEADAAKELLQALFPRVGGLFRKTGYGEEWSRTWAAEQRVASTEYFDRYFSYAVTPGDVSDQEIEHLVVLAKEEQADEVRGKIREAIDGQRIVRLIEKVRGSLDALDDDARRTLAAVLAGMGESFPNPEKSMRADTPFSQAAMLTARLIESLESEPERATIAREVLRNAEPASFAAVIFNWLRDPRSDRERSKALPMELYAELGRLIASRIEESARAGPLYRQSPFEASLMLRRWAEYGQPSAAAQHVERALHQDPRDAVVLLKAYRNMMLSSATGFTWSRFGVDEYKVLQQVIDPRLVRDALETAFGSNLDTLLRRAEEDLEPDERVVREFLETHARRQETDVTSGNDGA